MLWRGSCRSQASPSRWVGPLHNAAEMVSDFDVWMSVLYSSNLESRNCNESHHYSY